MKKETDENEQQETKIFFKNFGIACFLLLRLSCT